METKTSANTMHGALQSLNNFNCFCIEFFSSSTVLLLKLAPYQPEHRFKLIGYPKAIVTAQSEEHGVIKLNGEKFSIGDYVLAAPGHACTAVVKYPYSLVSDPSGEIIGKYNHDARDH